MQFILIPDFDVFIFSEEFEDDVEDEMGKALEGFK